MQMRKKLYIFKTFAKSKKLFFCQYLSFSVWFPLSLKHWSPLLYNMHAVWKHTIVDEKDSTPADNWEWAHPNKKINEKLNEGTFTLSDFQEFLVGKADMSWTGMENWNSLACYRACRSRFSICGSSYHLAVWESQRRINITVHLVYSVQINFRIQKKIKPLWTAWTRCLCEYDEEKNVTRLIGLVDKSLDVD